MAAWTDQVDPLPSPSSYHEIDPASSTTVFRRAPVSSSHQINDLTSFPSNTTAWRLSSYLHSDTTRLLSPSTSPWSLPVYRYDVIISSPLFKMSDATSTVDLDSSGKTPKPVPTMQKPATPQNSQQPPPRSFRASSMVTNIYLNFVKPPTEQLTTTDLPTAVIASPTIPKTVQSTAVESPRVTSVGNFSITNGPQSELTTSTFSTNIVGIADPTESDLVSRPTLSANFSESSSLSLLGWGEIPFKHVCSTYLPIVLSVLFRMMIGYLYTTVKMLEPFSMLSKPSGTLAKDFLWINYLSANDHLAPFQAMISGHWLMLWTSILYTAAQLLSPLAADLTGSSMIIYATNANATLCEGKLYLHPRLSNLTSNRSVLAHRSQSRSNCAGYPSIHLLHVDWHVVPLKKICQSSLLGSF